MNAFFTELSSMQSPIANARIIVNDSRVNPVTKLNKHAVASSFSKAASTYESAAAMQKEVALRLLAFANPDHTRALRLFDLGCGTGYFSDHLARTNPAARVTGGDIAAGMISYAQKHYRRDNLRWCCVDAEALPLANESYDLVFSSFALQWCPNLELALSEIQRVLSVEGTLAFSVPGNGTLAELQSSWATVDGYEHVNEFVESNRLLTLVKNAGFSAVDIRKETIVLEYPCVTELARELKALGAHNLNHGRAKALMGKAAVRKMTESYERFRNQNGLLPATYEVLYVNARK